MKKVIFSLLFMCSCFQFASAQIPVTDAANLANTTTNQVMNAATWSQQLTQLIQQSTILTTTLKYVQEVSSIVRDVAYTKNLIERQVYLTKECGNIVSHARFDFVTARNLENSITSILVTNNSLLSMLTSTLTTRFKMNDSERLQMLINIKKEQQELISSLNKVNMIIGTSQSTKDMLELQILK